VPPAESASRFRETVEIVLQAWTQDKLSFSGQHYRIDPVEVLPKPLQKPHPPVWVAATSEPAIEWAAGRGFSILMDPHATHREIGRKRGLYRAGLAAAGHKVTGRELPIARLVAVSDNTARAKAAARSGAQWIVDSYFGSQHRPVRLAEHTPEVADPVQRYLDEVIIHGTPDAVVDQILRLREEIGLDYLLAAPLSYESFMLLTDKVLPRLP
jgi:alkanesulfonate monooxygenase SsuD/methylene tetrahydromethanopterin reductase-like flavin-dependent oxidoreductase (luciferase family)